MASNGDDVPYMRWLRRAFLLVIGSTAVAVGALLMGTGSAQAQPVTIPGIGTFDIPGQVTVPESFQAPEMEDVPPSDIFPAAPDARGEAAVAAARSKLGSGYAAGGTGPNAFDCSGLVQWSYGQAGVDLPRTSHEQLATGTPVARNELRPGDMVSFYGGGHSALYSGDGKVIHASTSGAGVVESDMATMPFAGARRY